MRLKSVFTKLGLACALVFAAALPSAAFSEFGTPAWSTGPLTISDGPGRAYNVKGQIPAEVPIKVLRCQRDWCVVDAGNARGWTGIRNIGFGLSADPTILPRPAQTVAPQVCFFSGVNYTGTAICYGHDNRIEDLALHGLDNHFASVQLTGNITASACRDRFLQSYCERIVSSQPRLDQFLARNVSSIWVH